MLRHWIWERVKSPGRRSSILFLVMAAAAKKTAPSTFSWTDDEVELLLKVTNEYKVSKTADNVDWESVQLISL